MAPSNGAALQRLRRFLGHLQASWKLSADEVEDGTTESHEDFGLEGEAEEQEEEEEEEEEPEDEDSGPPSVASFFEKAKKKKRKYAEHGSFHRLYVSADLREVLLQVRFSELSLAFFHQLTFIGREGRLPDMVDITSSKAGFQFRLSPGEDALHLTQMQQLLPDTDLAASLYDPDTGGHMAGILQSFKILADDRARAKAAAEAQAEKDDQAAAEAQAVYFRWFANGDQSEAAPVDNESEQKAAENGAGESKPKEEKKKKQKDKKGKKEELKLDPAEESVLIDITAWLEDFKAPALSMGGPGRPMRSDAYLVEASAFPENFWFRYAAQPETTSPVRSSAKEATSYFSVAFCKLPDTLMTPRQKDRRVGYFETSTVVGGSLRANESVSAINRWNLERRGGIHYHVDPGVPKAYHAAIRRGVESWNLAFGAAGCGDAVVRCLLPSDADFPRDYRRGDARYNAVYMTDSALPVYGYGPSLTDFRTGEILVSHVLLGFSAFVQGASRYLPEALSEEYVNPTGRCRAPMLDANHPQILELVRSVVVHEVGHTLGLRHNFIACADGNTSVMAYPDDLDTTGPEARFLGHNLFEPGAYDVFAIKYGYTPLSSEKRGVRHPALDLLANGQEASEALAPEPRNPLFATDEDIGNEDPRVRRWNSAEERFGYDRLEHALRLRRELLQLVSSGRIAPEDFSSRLYGSYAAVLRYVLDGLGFLGGSLQDARRTAFEACDAGHAKEALRAVVDFCVGPLARLREEEGRHFVLRHPSRGYEVDRSYLLGLHANELEHVLASAVAADRLERLELQRALWEEAPAAERGAAPLRPIDALLALAFEPGEKAAALLAPFAPVLDDSLDFRTPAAPSAADLNAAARDPLRAEAASILARQVNVLAHDPHTLASVRAAARAFVAVAVKCLSTVDGAAGVDVLARAHWEGIKEQLLKEPKEQSQGSPGLFFGLFHDESGAASESEPVPGGGCPQPPQPHWDPPSRRLYGKRTFRAPPWEGQARTCGCCRL